MNHEKHPKGWFNGALRELNRGDSHGIETSARRFIEQTASVDQLMGHRVIGSSFVGHDMRLLGRGRVAPECTSRTSPVNVLPMVRPHSARTTADHARGLRGEDR